MQFPTPLSKLAQFKVIQVRSANQKPTSFKSNIVSVTKFEIFAAKTLT